MRKLRIALIFTMAIVTAALTSASGASNPTQGADIYGVGGGQTAGGLTQFDLSAHSSPSGDFGHVANKRPNLEVYTNVDCVNASAFPGLVGSAFISGTIKRVSPVPNIFGLNVGDRLDFLVFDGGNPSASAPVDGFYIDFGETINCKLLTLSFVLPPNVTQGNVNIKLG